jgi:uncharacterized protein
MADTGASRSPRDRPGWRRLGLFWLVLLTVTAAGSGALELLGRSDGKRTARAPVEATADAGKAAIVPANALPAAQVAGRESPGPVADLDAALLESLSGGSKQNLPRIAADGRTPMQVYAAGFDRNSRHPWIGLLVAGIGLNVVESDAAIRILPGAVSLAMSPYALKLTKLLETARAAGHEYLMAIPLEAAGFPLNDPGPNTLLTGLSASANDKLLHWALSRAGGYVGVTGVIGTMRGERLAAMTDQMDALLTEFGHRGLLYIDPREGRGPLAKAWGRHVDLVVDDPADRDVADRTMIDAQLAELEQRAKDNGSALGLVMQPSPVAVARIAAWSNGLTDRGLVLAPVSALVLPPVGAPVKLSEREP